MSRDDPKVAGGSGGVGDELGDEITGTSLSSAQKVMDEEEVSKKAATDYQPG